MKCLELSISEYKEIMAKAASFNCFHSARAFFTGLILLTCFLFSEASKGQSTHLDSLMLEVKKAKNDTILYQKYSGLFAYYTTFNRDSALKYAGLCIDLAQKNRVLSSVAHSYSRRATLYMYMGHYIEAFKDMNEALNIANKPFNKYSFWFQDSSYTADQSRLLMLADLHLNLAQLFVDINNQELEKYHYDESNRYYLLVTGKKSVITEYNEILTKLIFHHDTSVLPQLISLRNNEEFPSLDPYWQGSINLAIGRCYRLKNDLSNAWRYYNYSLEFTDPTDKVSLLFYSHELSHLFQAQGQPDSSLYYARSALGLIKDLRFVKQYNLNTAVLYKLLSKAFYGLKQFDSAWQYQFLASEINDSIQAVKLSQIVGFQNLSAEQQQKIVELNAQAEAYKTRTKLIGLVFFSALLLVAGLFFIRQYRLLGRAKSETERSLDQLKKAQAQLIQAEKMASLGELTAGIAHEIQNPLNFVNNFSEVNKELIGELREEISKGNLDSIKIISDDLEANEDKIMQHGKRADAIVKSMLQHSSISTGQKEWTDINALCDEYLRLAYHGLCAKDKSFNAKFETNLDPTLPKVNIIPQDLGRVILNLLNNAFYAVNERSKTDEAGYEPTVSVITKLMANGQLQIAVKDNASGIPENIKDKIFQPFFTTKPTGQGTGLGLSLAYDIITKGHGGTLDVVTHPGSGAEFKILLPIT